MTIKEQLLQELNSTSIREASAKLNRLIVETLNFLQFIKAKEQSNRSTEKYLLADSESAELYTLSLQGLNRAYSDNEPEYELSQIKEFNPSYEGR
jgi:hypothetical protein